MADRLECAPGISIPLAECEFSFVRSSGPGGQNVNKVNSKAVLRFPLAATASIGPELKARLLARLGSQLTVNGDLVIMSDRFRDQPRNREDCLTKLAATLAQASFVPKKRRKTKPSYSSQRRDQESKKRQSEKKRQRRGQD